MLHDKLQDIAMGRFYSESVLHEALNHPATRSNDKAMLHRFLFGITENGDHIKLQELAIEIRDWDYD